jgi:hypothetical protein
MKKGVILFHSNIKNIYDERWINKSIFSIINQTDNDFTFYEINYGGDDYSVVPKNCEIKNNFWRNNLSNYAEAMNFILDKAFNDNCDFVFNVNLDDFYHENRISKQIKMITEEDLDIISSDFCYIQEMEINNVKNDIITKVMNIQKTDINKHLENKHNVIAHPSVCYNKRFWSDNKNRYDITKTPEEDLDLWLNSIKRGYKFGIHSDVLLYYRIHKNQVSYK